jgi:hypothetical protein
MTTIWKYELKITFFPQIIPMPEDAKILSVQVQDGIPQLWALVNPDNRLMSQEILTIGTGHHIEIHPNFLKHIDTYQLNGLVFHIFDGGIKI